MLVFESILCGFIVAAVPCDVIAVGWHEFRVSSIVTYEHPGGNYPHSLPHFFTFRCF